MERGDPEGPRKEVLDMAKVSADRAKYEGPVLLEDDWSSIEQVADSTATKYLYEGGPWIRRTADRRYGEGMKPIAIEERGFKDPEQPDETDPEWHYRKVWEYDDSGDTEDPVKTSEVGMDFHQENAWLYTWEYDEDGNRTLQLFETTAGPERGRARRNTYEYPKDGIVVDTGEITAQGDDNTKSSKPGHKWEETNYYDANGEWFRTRGRLLVEYTDEEGKPVLPDSSDTWTRKKRNPPEEK